ncbi:hypothetical protein [Streptomyces sp. NBC_01602]|uniref:hypothetical protein n=1 Tax=Streptomyces sp. NBC_01602 TaxID=2975893 RepID=UPI003869B1F7|nr:DUF488 domain-containing protein [Streptomyces sp. NBC_01602]
MRGGDIDSFVSSLLEAQISRKPGFSKTPLGHALDEAGITYATSLPPGPEHAKIAAWLTFADAHLQYLAETTSAPKLPMPPKPSGTDLEPYLGHWSPHRPHSH